jgi:membrane associated rhomboid family serine protease
VRDDRGLYISGVWFLIIINVLLFVVKLLQPILFPAESTQDELVFRLGLQPAFFTEEPWTIVTSMFLHNDFFHLVFNMLALYFFGTYLSQLVGEGKFLVTYFLGGLLGGAFYILYGLYAPGADPYVLVIGASGAIFALGGALAVLRPNAKVIVFPIPAPVSLWVAVIGIFFVLNFLSLWLPIAWQAHLGGLVLGLIAGFVFRKRQRPFIRY